MGADPGEVIPDCETPQHESDLPAYRIGRFPVTNRPIRRVYPPVRKRRTCAKDGHGWFLREPPADRLDHPVTGVGWDDAVGLLPWLSGADRRRYRLPSEAEWEKAARGDDGRCYPWGPEWREGCVHAAVSGARGRDRAGAAALRRKPSVVVLARPDGASPCGCGDMLGNVQEWTATLWGTQPDQPQQSYRDRPDGGPSVANPADLPAQARMVHRGGSYKSQRGELRCSARGSAAPDSRIPWRGFRVAMEE